MRPKKEIKEPDIFVDNTPLTEKEKKHLTILIRERKAELKKKARRKILNEVKRRSLK